MKIYSLLRKNTTNFAKYHTFICLSHFGEEIMPGASGVSAAKKTATLREGRGFDYGEKSDDYSTTMGLYLGTRAFMMNQAMR